MTPHRFSVLAEILNLKDFRKNLWHYCHSKGKLVEEKILLLLV
jgi:hypothetical protein